MTLIEGSKAGKHGFIVLGISLVLLLVSIIWLLRWVRDDQSLDDKIKWLAYSQVATIVLLAVAIWIAVFEPRPSDIPPQLCELGSYYTQSSSICYQISEFPHCFPNQIIPSNPTNDYVCLSNQLCSNCTYG
jgi:hypothetical protein